MRGDVVENDPERSVTSLGIRVARTSWESVQWTNGVPDPSPDGNGASNALTLLSWKDHDRIVQRRWEKHA